MSKLITLGELYSTEDLELKIKELAKKKGFKLNQLADKIGYSSVYLSRIMNGHITFSLQHLEDIANGLDVHVHELIKLPKGYEHIYSEDSNEWQGTIKTGK